MNNNSSDNNLKKKKLKRACGTCAIVVLLNFANVGSLSLLSPASNASSERTQKALQSCGAHAEVVNMRGSDKEVVLLVTCIGPSRVFFLQSGDARTHLRGLLGRKLVNHPPIQLRRPHRLVIVPLPVKQRVAAAAALDCVHL